MATSDGPASSAGAAAGAATVNWPDAPHRSLASWCAGKGRRAYTHCASVSRANKRWRATWRILSSVGLLAISLQELPHRSSRVQTLTACSKSPYRGLSAATGAPSIGASASGSSTCGPATGSAAMAASMDATKPVVASMTASSTASPLCNAPCNAHPILCMHSSPVSLGEICPTFVKPKGVQQWRPPANSFCLRNPACCLASPRMSWRQLAS